MSSERKMHGRVWVETVLSLSDDGLKVAPFYFLVSKLDSRSNTKVKCEWLHEEGDSLKELFNYHQIFRKKVYRHTDTNDQAYSLRKKVVEMAREFELAYLFGHRQEITTDRNFFRSMGGLADFCKTKDIEESFIIDKKINGEIIKEIYKASTLGRFVFVPPHMYDELETFEVIPLDKTFRIPVKQVRSSIATVNVVADPMLLDKRPLGEGEERCWTVVVAELHGLTRIYLQNRDWQAWEIEEYSMPDADDDIVVRNTYKYNLLAEQSLIVLNPDAHLILNLKGDKK